jgi:hypothetical protein
VVQLRIHHDQDHSQVKAAIEAHKKSESVLTRAGLLIGGLWVTTLGLAGMAIWNHGWPWAKDIIIHWLQRANP